LELFIPLTEQSMDKFQAMTLFVRIVETGGIARATEGLHIEASMDARDPVGSSHLRSVHS
jgi:hypothetical protein